MHEEICCQAGLLCWPAHPRIAASFANQKPRQTTWAFEYLLFSQFPLLYLLKLWICQYLCIHCAPHPYPAVASTPPTAPASEARHLPDSRPSEER
jgi:hypothetical protein